MSMQQNVIQLMVRNIIVFVVMSYILTKETPRNVFMGSPKLLILTDKICLFFISTGEKSPL